MGRQEILQRKNLRYVTEMGSVTVYRYSPPAGYVLFQDIPCICVLKAIMLKWDT